MLANASSGLFLCFLVLMLLLVIFYAARSSPDKNHTDLVGEKKDAAPPATTNLLLMGMKKWSTVQDMLRWKNEMNRLDGILGQMPRISTPQSPPLTEEPDQAPHQVPAPHPNPPP